MAASFRPCVGPAAEGEGHGVAIDGNAQRGWLRFAATGCPVHALSAYCHASDVVLAHEPIAVGPLPPDA